MGRRFLLFSAGGTRYALDLSEVAEVQERPPLYPVPLVPPHVLGVMKFHGTLTAVLDLSLLREGRGVEGGKVLVLDPRTAACALAAEEVGSIVAEESVLFRGEAESPLPAARLETAQGEVSLLELPALLALLEGELQR